MGLADDTIVVTTLNEIDILVGQVYCKVELVRTERSLTSGVDFRE